MSLWETFKFIGIVQLLKLFNCIFCLIKELLEYFIPIASLYFLDSQSCPNQALRLFHLRPM